MELFEPICAGRAPDTEQVLSFVAGDSYDFEVICGELGLDSPGCLPGDWHSGDNNDDYSGCALSIDYSGDYKNMSNHRYISYSSECAKRGTLTNFKIAENVNNCERCVCSWTWAPSRDYSSLVNFIATVFTVLYQEESKRTL